MQLDERREGVGSVNCKGDLFDFQSCGPGGQGLTKTYIEDT